MSLQLPHINEPIEPNNDGDLQYGPNLNCICLGSRTIYTVSTTGDLIRVRCQECSLSNCDVCRGLGVLHDNSLCNNCSSNGILNMPITGYKSTMIILPNNELFINEHNNNTIINSDLNIIDVSKTSIENKINNNDYPRIDTMDNNSQSQSICCCDIHSKCNNSCSCCCNWYDKWYNICSNYTIINCCDMFSRRWNKCCLKIGRCECCNNCYGNSKNYYCGSCCDSCCDRGCCSCCSNSNCELDTVCCCLNV
jgi:hypothetical protein